MALVSGTYYIYSPGLQTYLQFNNDGIGLNLTSWHFEGTKVQQWELSLVNSTSATFRNSASNMYIVWHANSANVISGVLPMDWVLNQTSGNYMVSLDSTLNSIWDIELVNGNDNASIILYPAKPSGQTVNQLWNFQPVPPESKSSTQSAPVIAGATVGSAVGLGLLVLAFWQSHHLVYLLGSLAFAVFGWWLFRGRRIVVFSEVEGAVQITFFLSPLQEIQDSGPEAETTLVVWQVADIGHSRKGSTIFCPCVSGNAETELGFGTIEDRQDSIAPVFSAVAPAEWNGSQWVPLQSAELILRNNSGMPTDMAVGTYETKKEKFLPYLRLNNIQAEGTYTASRRLYLHAFVTNGYENGKYGETLVNDVRGDIITTRGISLTDLKPITHWRIYRDTNRKLCLDIKGTQGHATNSNDIELTPRV